MAAYTSVKSGNFNDPLTWGGASYPSVDGDTATITAGHEVIYNVDGSAINLGAITVSGILRCSRTMTTYLKLGSGDSSITVNAKGAVYWGDSELAPIPAAYKATICFTFNRADRGIEVNATGIAQFFGDPLYQPDKVRRLAANWTSGKTFTVVGNVLTSWRSGDKLSLTDFKYAISASPHDNQCVLCTIDTMAANGSNTDITIVEAYSIPCDAGGPIINLSCNNVLITSTYDVLDKTSLIGRWFLTKGGTAQNGYDYPIKMAYVTAPVCHQISVPYNFYARGCLFRNSNYPVWFFIDSHVYDSIYFATFNIYGVAGSVFSGCYFGPYSGTPRDFTSEVLFENCYVWSSRWTGPGGHNRGYLAKFVNVKFFCNGTYTAGYGNTFSLFQDCCWYLNYAGFFGLEYPKFERCYFGYDENGVQRRFVYSGDMYVDYWGPQAYFKDCKVCWTGAGGVDPTSDGRRNNVMKRMELYFSNYDQVSGSRRHISCFGDVYADSAIHNLASISLRAVPLSNCGYTGPILLPITKREIEFINWTENNVAASAQHRRVYVRGAAWVSFPTSAELYIEAEYYNATGAWTTTTKKSTEVLTVNGTWLALTLDFVPARIGPVTYRVVLAKYAAGASIYLDHALYYSATEFLEADFDWGKSVLPASRVSFPVPGHVRNLVAYGRSGELIGTDVLPAAAQTLLGVGFGAAGTEFTGELALEIPGADFDLAEPAISFEIVDPLPITMEVD